MRLENKVALITGAGSGIGRATAVRFAQEGARVLATDVSLSAVQTVCDQIAGSGGHAAAYKLDVSQESDWSAVLSAATGDHGAVDVLVNNAGIASFQPLHATSVEDWRRIMATNLDGVFIGCRTVIPTMNDGGSVINVSSMFALVATLNGGGYEASKGGVKMLSKAFALELAASGSRTRVNSIHPGGVETEMFRTVLQSGDEQAAEMQAFVDAHPLGRLAQPEEIAAAILFLASDESRFMTGSELVIDGGYTAR